MRLLKLEKAAVKYNTPIIVPTDDEIATFVLASTIWEGLYEWLARVHGVVNDQSLPNRVRVGVLLMDALETLERQRLRSEGWNSGIEIEIRRARASRGPLETLGLSRLGGYGLFLTPEGIP